MLEGDIPSSQLRIQPHQGIHR
ncbi:hypothetical protein LINGRAHAP2_LOCUS20739 [Linum grandiflorum]